MLVLIFNPANQVLKTQIVQSAKEEMMHMNKHMCDTEIQGTSLEEFCHFFLEPSILSTRSCGLQVMQCVDVVELVYGKFCLFLIEPCWAQRALPKRKVTLKKAGSYAVLIIHGYSQ